MTANPVRFNFTVGDVRNRTGSNFIRDTCPNSVGEIEIEGSE